LILFTAGRRRKKAEPMGLKKEEKRQFRALSGVRSGAHVATGRLCNEGYSGHLDLTATVGRTQYAKLLNC
jgi:hypothetical protein